LSDQSFVVFPENKIVHSYRQNRLIIIMILILYSLIYFIMLISINNYMSKMLILQ
jgi:hypothetical protein